MELAIINLTGALRHFTLDYKDSGGTVNTHVFDLDVPILNAKAPGSVSTAYWSNVKTIISITVEGNVCLPGDSPVLASYKLEWHLGSATSVVILMEPGEPMVRRNRRSK